jgi:TfoX/Sxy family transcriptional regulator of competence genes
MEKFKKQDETAARLFELLVKGIDCERRKMFGYSVAFINGNMFAGVFADRLFFRIKTEDQAAMKAAEKGLRDFEPMSGRRMKEYLEIDAEAADPSSLQELVTIAERNARALPAKAKKAQ